MIKTSRVITTTLVGLVLGIISMLLARYIGEPDAFWPVGISLLIFYTVMAIAVVGQVPFPSINFGASVVWGFLIELLATKAFKQPQ